MTWVLEAEAAMTPAVPAGAGCRVFTVYSSLELWAQKGVEQVTGCSSAANLCNRALKSPGYVEHAPWRGT
jgi:hypothetical protein